VENFCECGFSISAYEYTYDDAGLIVAEKAVECLETTNKDYAHVGGSNDQCAHKQVNPWMNQNPQHQTTNRTFEYDDNGQLIKCVENKRQEDGQFWKYTYTYEYDTVGNRTKAKKQDNASFKNPDATTYEYNADNQMVSAMVCESNTTKPYKFTYDANGNLTKKCFHTWPETTYQYDTENRLKAVSNAHELLMAAVYDGDGNRAFQLNYNTGAVCGYGKNMSGEVYIPVHNKNEDGSLTAEGELFSYICSETGRSYDLIEYVNDTTQEYTQVLEAYTINSAATEAYTYGNGRVSRNNYWIEARDVTHNEMSYYLYDGRGSVTGNTWHNGMLTDVYQYDPYGKVTLGSTKHTEFYGYNAESYNPNTGLEYLRARYYNPNKGRFFQEDGYLGNITDPLTLNRYAYTKNSPLNYMDPSGHEFMIFEVDRSGYMFLPDTGKGIRTLTGGASLFMPFIDILGNEAYKKGIETSAPDYITNIEFIDYETVPTQKTVSDLSFSATTISFLSDFIKMADSISGVISKTSWTLSGLSTYITYTDIDPDISQIIYYWFGDYMQYVDTRDNILGRYAIFKTYIETLINWDILTYDLALCGKVDESSIMITDMEAFNQMTKNLGFSVEKILELFP